MSWIKAIGYNDADPDLKRIYDRVSGPGNSVDNVLTVHSLRPHTLLGHMTLYKSVLHSDNNTLHKWFLEAIGVYVSMLNNCEYCIAHHLAGLKRILKDDKKFGEFHRAVKNDVLESFFDPKYLRGMRYAKKLTQQPDTILENDIKQLKTVGFMEGEILEINQVTSYFNYVNRTVLGLGVNIQGDILGLSPNTSDDPLNWSHQ
jgi:uncharacterized peroxidase-related enzyme